MDVQRGIDVQKGRVPCKVQPRVSLVTVALVHSAFMVVWQAANHLAAALSLGCPILQLQKVLFTIGDPSLHVFPVCHMHTVMRVFIRIVCVEYRRSLELHTQHEDPIHAALL